MFLFLMPNNLLKAPLITIYEKVFIIVFNRFYIFNGQYLTAMKINLKHILTILANTAST